MQTIEQRRAYQLAYYHEAKHYLGVREDVPIGPARAHVMDLRLAGMGVRGIAKAAGVREHTVQDIYAGNRARGIRPETEARILSVRPDPYRVAPEALTRRVRALNAIGWTKVAMEQHSGVHNRVLSDLMTGRSKYVTRATARAVEAMYDALSMTPGPSQKSRRLAANKGWPPPLAWSDIDDPDEQPDYGAKPTARGADIDEWLFLVEGGEDPERAAERLGVLIDAIAQQAYRKGREDVYRIAWPASQRIKNRRAREAAQRKAAA